MRGHRARGVTEHVSSLPVRLDEDMRRAEGWPLPGSGATLLRWSALATLANEDLVVARLCEAHVDAGAIFAELDNSTVIKGHRWGVWAAEVPNHPLRAELDQGWSVTGSKAWCSGATLLSHALVTARYGDERLLFAVALDQSSITVGRDDWAAAGMKRADTRVVSFKSASAQPVGSNGWYLSRPGFWIGGIGVAACWYGGSAAVAAPLRDRVAAGSDPHAAAHLGAVDVALGAARDVLRAAARAVDAEPHADHAALARRVRSTVAQVASEVLSRVRRALGPGLEAADAAHAQRVADLEVYIQQDHAERDLQALGIDVAAGPRNWSL